MARRRSPRHSWKAAGTLRMGRNWDYLLNNQGDYPLLNHYLLKLKLSGCWTFFFLSQHCSWFLELAVEQSLGRTCDELTNLLWTNCPPGIIVAFFHGQPGPSSALSDTNILPSWWVNSMKYPMSHPISSHVFDCSIPIVNIILVINN